MTILSCQFIAFSVVSAGANGGEPDLASHPSAGNSLDTEALRDSLCRMPEMTPQFGTAEYSNVPGTERCALCQQIIGATYYRLNGSMACASCADRAKSGLPVDSGSSYIKALILGSAAAFLGFLIYSAVGIMTGLEIGYVSLAVGFLVGVAMKKGAGGVGGRKYQITAAVLVYSAVSMSALPIYFWTERDKFKSERPAQQQAANPGTHGTEPSDAASGGGAEKPTATESKPMSFAMAIGVLLLIGLASPFLGLASNPVSALIGLFILYIGINFAWRSTAAAPLAIDGPYDITPKSSTATAG